MKRLLTNLTISKVFCCMIVLGNLFLPLYPGKYLNTNLFQFAVIAMWIFGLLSHLGYVKRQVSASEDGIVEYETIIPIVPLGFTRIAQCIYYVIRKPKISWVMLIILIGLDALYVAFLLWDKSNYYYESEMKEDA